MTTTIPTADALLAAIAAHPEEDTPRLMYADYLQENGQEDRAEFIRVQFELEKWTGIDRLRAKDGLDPHPKELELRSRESAILAKRPDWLRVTCPACGEEGHRKPLARKWFAHWDGCPFCSSGSGTLPLVLRRGFPWRVTVPKLELVGVERQFCRACRESRGEWNEIDRHSYCARCDSNHPLVVDTAIPRFVPTDHTRKLLAMLPTCGELVAGDKRPLSLIAHQNTWFRGTGGEGAHPLHNNLPSALFDAIEARGLGCRDGDWLSFDTDSEAISALGVTICGIVRK